MLLKHSFVGRDFLEVGSGFQLLILLECRTFHSIVIFMLMFATDYQVEHMLNERLLHFVNVDLNEAKV